MLVGEEVAGDAGGEVVAVPFVEPRVRRHVADREVDVLMERFVQLDEDDAWGTRVKVVPHFAVFFGQLFDSLLCLLFGRVAHTSLVFHYRCRWQVLRGELLLPGVRLWRQTRLSLLCLLQE